MDVAFVKDSQDHVHDKDGREEKHCQTAKELPEYERFTLKCRLNAWYLLTDLGKAVFDKFSRIADRNVWKQIEIDSDTGELIEVINRLGSDNLLCRCHGAQRNKIRSAAGGSGNCATGRARRANCAPAIPSDIKIVEVGRLHPLTIFYLENHLVLIFGLFDQINIILGVSRPQQTLH